MPQAIYCNTPSVGASTRKEAIAEFVRRNSHEGMNRITQSYRSQLMERNAGICYEDGGGSTVYIDWADLTSAECEQIGL